MNVYSAVKGERAEDDRERSGASGVSAGVLYGVSSVSGLCAGDRIRNRCGSKSGEAQGGRAATDI